MFLLVSPTGFSIGNKVWFTTDLCKVFWSQNDAKDASSDIID